MESDGCTEWRGLTSRRGSPRRCCRDHLEGRREGVPSRRSCGLRGASVNISSSRAWVTHHLRLDRRDGERSREAPSSDGRLSVGNDEAVCGGACGWKGSAYCPASSKSRPLTSVTRDGALRRGYSDFVADGANCESIGGRDGDTSK